LTGVAVLVIGQFLFAILRSPWTRAVIAAVYSAPAGIGGWCSVHGLFALIGAGDSWLTAFAWIGGVAIAGMAWLRATALKPEIEPARRRGRALGQRAWPGAHPPSRLPNSLQNSLSPETVRRRS
jgi:hypothetical protein